MKANARTPAEVFGNSVRYVVPLFQRPYVWTQDLQWQPLWDDVRELAERVMQAPPVSFGPAPVPPHFLGAVVVDQQATPSGFIDVRHVIDGQQRLTTLQLLLDAVQGVVQELGQDGDAAGLLSLVQNNPALAGQPHEVFKVWPTDRDQAAFVAVLTDDVVPTSLQASTPIASAHRYFSGAARDWAVESGADATPARLNALTRALVQHLSIVVIDLDPGDNAQVIFETLNHRGSPLLAADLVKNLLFQVAQAQGLDVAALYRAHWQEFDTDPWRAPQSQGRRLVPRIDLFLHHWLTMRLLRDVPTDRVFADFRDKVVRPTADVGGLMAELAHDARVYASFDAFDATSVPGRFHYRVVKALDSAVVSPFLLWALRHPPEQLPIAQRDKALGAVESWMVRRAIARATSKDLNNAVLSLLKRVREAPVAELGDVTVAYLEGQTADSRAWPDDETLREALLTSPVYVALTRPRLRMVLEALEDSLRGPLGEGQPCPRGLTVEHVMPRAWHDRWAADLTDDEDVVAMRDTRVHTLGNLTLVTGKLNPTLSNRPWRDDPAPGKRTYLLQHAQLKLSATIAARHEVWTDDDIRRRTAELAQRVLDIWPGPAIGRPVTTTEPPASASTHEATSAAPAAPSQPPMELALPRLTAWLREQSGEVLHLPFDDVEQLLGTSLVDDARTSPHRWFDASSALATAITDAGWRVGWVDISGGGVLMAPADQQPGSEEADEAELHARTPSPRDSSSLLDLIDQGIVTEGTALSGRYRGQTYVVTVRGDGRLETQDAIYASLSKAVTGVTGQPSVNGWLFWRTPDGTVMGDLRRRPR